jgi:hypothetical protein
MGWDHGFEDRRVRMKEILTYFTVMSWYSPTEIEIIHRRTSSGENLE